MHIFKGMEYLSTAHFQGYGILVNRTFSRVSNSETCAYFAVSAAAAAVPEVIPQSAQIRDEVLPAMEALREACDTAETLTEKKRWPFPNYAELLFGV